MSAPGMVEVALTQAFHQIFLTDIPEAQAEERNAFTTQSRLLEHFPDEYTPLCIEMHRRFLKPGGDVVMTTPHNQFKSRVSYHLLSDFVNHGYRVLMDVNQLGGVR